MSEAKKYRTYWEILHPGEPLPSAEEFDAMQERAYGSWQRYFDEDPTLIEAFRRDCGCGPSVEADDE